MTASGGKAERCNAKLNGKLDFWKMSCQKGWADANQRVNDCMKVDRGGKEGGGQMRKGAHRWGAVDPVDMFNELNWFMGLAYILSTVSLSHTFTDTVRWIIVPCLIYWAENAFTLRRARLQPPFRTFSVIWLFSHVRMKERRDWKMQNTECSIYHSVNESYSYFSVKYSWG